MSRRVRAGKTAMVILLATVGTASCSDGVVAPRVAPDSVAPSQSEAAYELFSGTVEPTWSRHRVIPDSVWILVEVTGRVRYSRNPFCFQVRGYCDAPPLPIETEGPQGPLQDGGEVRVTTQLPGQPEPYFQGQGDRLFSPTDDPRGAVGRLLFHNTSGPAWIWTQRGERQIYAGNTSSPTVGYWPVFIISGEQTVTIHVVPTPLRVTGPAAVSPGDSAVWRAEVVGDFRLRHAGARPAVLWEFFPGDTFSTHNRFAPRQTLPCTESECRTTPDQSGRMVASTYVEGQYVRVASEVFRVDSARLELTCNDAQDSVRMVRAERLSCEVSGADEIIGWEFVADSSGYRNPAEGATAFKGIAWAGPVVLSGTVSVQARVAGQEEGRSVRVSVSPRSWSGKSMERQVSEQPVPAGHMPSRPDSLKQLGHIEPMLDVEISRDVWDLILSGPNANLAYLTDLPVSYHGIIHINRIALAVGSDFWNAQHTRQRSRGVVDCQRREQDIIGFIPVILRHEGVGFDPKSHAFLFVEAAERVGNPLFERVIGASRQELEDQAKATTRLVGDSAATASARADSSGYAPQWCRFNFNYTGR